MKVNVSSGSRSFPLELDSNHGINTFGDLKQAICAETNLDITCLKIIHRGKTLSGDDFKLIEEFNIKDNDKLLVMGKAKAALKDDPGFSALLHYEKDHLIGLQKQYDEIQTDLTELEKNHLDATKSREMVKRMDKRLKMFVEVGERHLEALDGLNIVTESTAPEQATRNREKRKSLIVGVQQLLNVSDKFTMRLEQYTKKLNGEVVE